MALPAALETDLRNTLRRFHAAGGITSIPGGAGKALEAWLLMRLADNARTASGWQVTLRSGDGLPLPPGAQFCFPTGQSGIHAMNPAAPGFILLEHPSDSSFNLEMHCGLRWKGRSAATHECDVSVLPASIATVLRVNGGGMPEGLPIAAFECKDKTSSGTADEMRQSLARLFDLALVTKPESTVSCRIWDPKSKKQWGRRSSKYLSFFARGAFGIVRVGSFHRGARQLGHHYSIRRFGSIYDPAGKSLGSLLLRGFRNLVQRGL